MVVREHWLPVVQEGRWPLGVCGRCQKETYLTGRVKSDLLDIGVCIDCSIEACRLASPEDAPPVEGAILIELV